MFVSFLLERGISVTSDIKHVRDAELIVTIGGDGTVLHVAKQIQDFPSPLIVPFSMGTLGFLLPFDVLAFNSVLQSILSGKGHVLQRNRLSVEIKEGARLLRSTQVLNEVNVQRGRAPQVIRLECHVNGVPLTHVVV